MAHLPQVSGKDITKALVRAGYRPISQKGSHMKLRRENPRRTIIVPNHKTIKRGTLRGIIADASLRERLKTPLPKWGEGRVRG